MAIEGVQPSIPQNPTSAEARAQELVPKGPGASQSLAALAGNDNVTFKPQVKHILSKELMLYFEKIRGAILDQDSDEEVIRLRKAALASVKEEGDLQQLVPYFVQFISEKVTHNTKNVFVLQQMMELTSALIGNESMYIDPYTATLCASVLTCLIGRGNPNDTRAQYQLREYTASLIGLISKKYAKSSQQLKPRLARTCLKYFLDPKKPLDIHYGAISGLAAVGGPEAVRMLIIPNLKAYDSVLSKAQIEGGEDNINVDMVIGAILKAIKSVSDDSSPSINGNSTNEDDQTSELVDFLGPIIGERVAALRDYNLEKAILEIRD